MLGLAGRKSGANGPARGGGQLSKIQRDFMDLVYDSGMSKGRHKQLDRIRLFLETADVDVRPVLVNLQEVSQEFRPYNVHAMGKWEGYTPLHVACHYGYEDVCKLFLAFKADPNIAEKDRCFAPLHTAVSRNLATAENLVSLLLQEGADPNLEDRQGNTPLHTAIAEVREFHRIAKPGAKMNFNAEAVIEALLQWGADPLRTNQSGETPFYLAQAQGGGIEIPFLKDQHAKLLKQQLRVELLAQPLFGPALDASFHDLEDQDSELLEWCTAESSMVDVSFARNRLTAKAFTPRLLQQLRHLTSLNLQHNALGDEGVAVLLSALGQVTSLNLGDNGITKDGMEMVAEFASRAQQLKELQLEGNLSPGDSLHSLGRALVQNPNLRWLNLARCAIGESDALLCICQITGPRTLPFGIDLRGNGLKNTAKMLRHLEHQKLPALLCVEGQVTHTEHLSFFDAPLIRSVQHLVLEGGGVKGVAYLGALRTLEAHDIHFRDLDGVAGTSVGAITATLLAVGYSGPALSDILENLPLDSFMDFDEQLHGNKRFNLDEIKKDIREVMQGFNGGLSMATVLISSKEALSRIKQVVEFLDAHDGLCQGDEIRRWIETKIQDKVGIDHLTFYELHHLNIGTRQKPQELSMVGLNLSTGQTEVFSYRTTPFVVISDAVRISLSIPFIFRPHQKYLKYPRPPEAPTPPTSPPLQPPCFPPPPLLTLKEEKAASLSTPQSDAPPPAPSWEAPQCEGLQALVASHGNSSDSLSVDLPAAPMGQAIPTPSHLPGQTPTSSPMRRPPPSPSHNAFADPSPTDFCPAYPPSPIILASQPGFPRTTSVRVPSQPREVVDRPRAGSLMVCTAGDGGLTQIVRSPAFNRSGKLLSLPGPTRSPAVAVSLKDHFRAHGRHQDLSLHRYVDGAVTCNYPLCIVPRHSALGMRLLSSRHFELLERNGLPPTKATKGLRNYSTALLQGYLQGSLFLEEQREDNLRTIYVNTGDVGGVDTAIDKAQQQRLMQAGRDAVVSFLATTMRQYLLQLTSFRGASSIPATLRPVRPKSANSAGDPQP